MSISSGRFIVTALLLVPLLGCSKQADPPHTTASTQGQTKTAEPQSVVAPKTEIRKAASVSEIDFSKYPGVIKPGAFGFFFGLTPEQIQQAGIELESVDSDGDFSIYKAGTAPANWDGAETYILIFAKNTLIKIRAIGKEITSDSTGTRGKEAYKELASVLTEKYGKPEISAHKIGLRLYKERDEFYQCLAYDGCGLWLDVFKSTDRHILVQLNGMARGKGLIELSYEAQPEWGNALDQHKAAKKETTKKGL